MQTNRAAKTVAAYNHAWGVFERWCIHQAGRDPLPASFDTVELFVTWALRERPTPYRIESVKLFLAAIRNRHVSNNFLSPVSPDARALISNAARDPSYQVENQKEAITPEQLYRMCRSLSNDPLDVRDRSILVLGFASGFRAGELASLELRDVSFEEESGDLLIHLRRSKTDQFGEGRRVRIQPGRRVFTCPVRQLRRWLQLRGDWRGPLFSQVRRGQVVRMGLEGRTICFIVQRSLQRIGVDPSSYGAHSLRAGMVTAAVENGASEFAIAERTGHKTIKIISRYVRAARGLRVNPLKGKL